MHEMAGLALQRRVGQDGVGAGAGEGGGGEAEPVGDGGHLGKSCCKCVKYFSCWRDVDSERERERGGSCRLYGQQALDRLFLSSLSK